MYHFMVSKHTGSFFAVKTVLLLTCLFFLSGSLFADEGFPGRKLYPQVQTLSKEQLHEKITNDEVVVVDVRSAYEYKTLKVLNAQHIHVAEKSFRAQLEELRQSTPKAIVFYCNGRSCYKSYKAGMKAIKYNVKNCFVYDAGVFEWALAYPEQAELLGETPVTNDRIISKNEFKSRLLTPKEFEQKLSFENTVVYDVRDREQRRGGGGLFMFRDKNVGLENEKKLNRIISQAIELDSTLLFYDQKGKQVRWLQYLLERKGLENYYFMKGGAGAYYDMMRKEQAL